MSHLLESFRPAATVAVILLGLAGSEASGQNGWHPADQPGSPHRGVGCPDPACNDRVCTRDPHCCETRWDEYCTALAVEHCGTPVPTILIAHLESTATLPNGLVVKPCDLVAFNPVQSTWHTYLDGSDVGLGRERIAAAAVAADGAILVAIEGAGLIDGLRGGPDGEYVTPFDVLRFQPSSLGENTAGEWHFHLDGSDIGLANSRASRIQTLSCLADGSLVLSLRGPCPIGSLGEVNPWDLLRFEPERLGSDTAGTWFAHLRGDSTGLAIAGASLDAAFIEPDGRIILSTRDSFTSRVGVSGRKGDLLAFNPSGREGDTVGSMAVLARPSDLGLASSVNLRSAFTVPWPLPTGDRPAACERVTDDSCRNGGGCGPCLKPTRSPGTWRISVASSGVPPAIEADRAAGDRGPNAGIPSRKPTETTSSGCGSRSAPSCRSRPRYEAPRYPPPNVAPPPKGGAVRLPSGGGCGGGRPRTPAPIGCS